MTNAINEAIDAHAAHDLAEALASAGVTAARSGWPNSDDEACEVAGYGRVFFHDTPPVLFLGLWIQGDSGWQVRDLDGCDYPISQTELANELAEVVAMTKQVS